MEQRATDLGRVYAKLKRDNPEIHVLSHQWLYDCRDKRRRLELEGYEITRQPLPPAKKGTRTAFTPEDDMKLVKFIARNSKPKGRLGHSLYEDVERALPNHTASSWRQRYKTNQARLDQEIARYEAIVQQRRDNHEDPYTDSEDESSKYTATSGRGAWPSRSQITQKKATRPVESIPQRQSTSLSPAAPPGQGLKRSAIKSQRPTVEGSRTSQAEERRFRLDFQGPGERITFSDEEDESDVEQPVTRPSVRVQEAEEAPSQYTQESISESVREELRQRGFPPMARKRRRSTSADEKGEEELIYVRHVQQKRSNFLDLPSSPPARTVSVSSHPEQPTAQTGPSGSRRLRSRSLPAILSEVYWNHAHLNTLLSLQQMEDLVFVCNGDVSLASQIATLLYQSEVEGWNTARKQRAATLRRMMWMPEEDAFLAQGIVNDAMLERHGEESVQARVEYLQEKYAAMDDEERRRRRFPFDGSAA